MKIKLFVPVLCIFLISCGSDKETTESIENPQSSDTAANNGANLVFQSSKSQADFDVDKLIAQAKMGDTNAMMLLAMKYKNGEGVKKDLVLAEQWIRKAADVGDSIAQDNLAVMYRDGEGLDKNPEQAVKWFTNSAKQGNQQAQGNLAQMYMNGSGIQQDLFLAFAWSKLAVKNGNTTFAKTNMDLAEKYLSNEQLLAATALANSWKPGQELVNPKPPAAMSAPNAKTVPAVVAEPKK